MVGDAGEYRHVVSALRQVVGDVVVGEIGANPASIRSVRAAIRIGLASLLAVPAGEPLGDQKNGDAGCVPGSWKGSGGIASDD